ncbi:metallophosphoesterase [Variovorax sp. RTB1]|uniref:metallophosphoesterase family protein n=1 Tax=Variovorax sp. RTB1 TaxID=3048631 RepID=UPI002B22BBE7|nr:metallophosphoesterase [Variovorax sp. RTB1]MEB0113548.1 metallophosphoesterase [Variovorax sp. RTB1]
MSSTPDLLPPGFEPRQDPLGPKILFFGDPHGDFAPVLRAVERLQPEAIVLLGDIQSRTPLHDALATIRAKTDIWFIHGNHDTDSDSDYDNLWGSELADRNLHGRVAEVAGYKVAGLGGVFRGKVWDPVTPMEDAAFDSPQKMLQHVNRGGRHGQHDLWRGGISRKHRSSIFPSHYRALLAERAEILVTHEAPGAYHHGFEVLDELAAGLRARLLVHGHHHKAIDYRREGLTPADSPFRAFGIDMGGYLAWPLGLASVPGGPLP